MMAEPTMAPSEMPAMRAACSGVEMPKPMATGVSVFVLFEREIRQDQSVDADLLTCTDELLGSVRENNVRICHEDHRNRDIGSQVAHEIEYLVRCDTAVKSS